MKRFQDWNIFQQLFVPFFVVLFVLSSVSIGVFYFSFAEIRKDVLPELRMLGNIDTSSHDLVNIYYAYFVTPDIQLLEGIADLERRQLQFISVYSETAQYEATESRFAEQIGTSLTRMQAVGDEAVIIRGQIDELLKLKLEVEIEKYEDYLEDVADFMKLEIDEAFQARDIETIQKNALPELDALSGAQIAAHDLLSELREFILHPTDVTRAEIGAIFEQLSQHVADFSATALHDADEVELAKQMLVLTDQVIASAEGLFSVESAFSVKLKELKFLSNELFSILDEAELISTTEADEAFDAGFGITLVVVAGTAMSSLAFVFFIASLVSNEQSAAEEKLRRNERLSAIGQAAATVSHELRNPLGAIRSGIDALAKMAGEDHPGMLRAIALIDRSLTRCTRIVSELLDYTRSSGLELRSTGMDGWFNRLLDEYDTPPALNLERSVNSGVRLAIDRDRLSQAVCNILDNACQAMAEIVAADDDGASGCVLTVGTRIANENLEISIADSGVGIPPGELDKIFEPLHSTKTFGTGLGLSVVKQVMEQHGGGISIESDLGDGTKVVLWLPLRDVHTKETK